MASLPRSLKLMLFMLLLMAAAFLFVRGSIEFLSGRELSGLN